MVVPKLMRCCALNSDPAAHRAHLNSYAFGLWKGAQAHEGEGGIGAQMALRDPGAPNTKPPKPNPSARLISWEGAP